MENNEIRCGNCRYFKEHSNEEEFGDCMFPGLTSRREAIIYGLTKRNILPCWCAGSFEKKVDNSK